MAEDIPESSHVVASFIEIHQNIHGIKDRAEYLQLF